MPANPRDELAAGAVVGGGRFAVIALIGSGAQGRTYEAIDKSTGTVVALKRFSVRGASSWKDVELAQREAAVLAGLDHPLLPRYLAHFEEDGSLYLAMERVEGITLKQLRDERRFEQRDVVAFLNDAASTLTYLHSRAPCVVHRDIKPSNVIRRLDGRFALVDFGAVAGAFKPEGGSTVVGTYGYMAPEQFQGRAMPASDLYSVAATALSMLTGAEPDKLPHKGLAIDVAACLGHEVDPRLRTLLLRALDPDPDVRSKETLETRLGHCGLRVRSGGSFKAQTSASAGPEAGSRGAAQASSQKQRQGQHQSSSRRHSSSGVGGVRGVTGGPVLLIVMVALAIARVSTAAVMVLVLPMLLTLLSFVFGPGLKRAARQVALAGRHAQKALRRSGERIRRVAQGEDTDPQRGRPDSPHKRTRVSRRHAGAQKMRFRVSDLERGVGGLERNLEEIEREIDDVAKATRIK